MIISDLYKYSYQMYSSTGSFKTATNPIFWRKKYGSKHRCCILMQIEIICSLLIDWFWLTGKVEMRLQHMHSTPKENLRLYGENMVRLVEILEKHVKNGKFEKMPIGPIANHVEVKDGQYRQCVEDTLGNTLSAFCIDNNNDVAVFREIMKKMSFNVPLICSKFHDQQYNVSGKCVESDNHTVRLMDLIVVDSPVVMNCLIDQCNIETILFTKSFEYATHITSKKENVPRNLSKVILLEPYSEYFPAPSYRSYTKQKQPSRNLRVNAVDREK